MCGGRVGLRFKRILAFQAQYLHKDKLMSHKLAMKAIPLCPNLRPEKATKELANDTGLLHLRRFRRSVPGYS